jgi:hypothetical protein
LLPLNTHDCTELRFSRNDSSGSFVTYWTELRSGSEVAAGGAFVQQCGLFGSITGEASIS